jgi:pyridoxamine 5'-phosphate oxidase
MAGDFTQASEPFSLFDAWLDEAKAAEPNDPNAMAIATAGADGLPDVRMVLMKGYDAQGVVFYTNTLSAKGRELTENPQAAALFHWKSLQRQVRFRGPVERVSDAEADAYFQSRPRDSRIGAWASQQSQPLEGRFALEKAVAFHAAKFGLGEVPRPPHWTGFRLKPTTIEFWHDRPFRLHDRIVFRRINPKGPVPEAVSEATSEATWTRERLYP